MTASNKKTQTPPQAGDWEGFFSELGRNALELGLALGKAAEDITGLMIIQADGELRSKLDMLVESGAVRTRAEALKILYEAGLEKKEKIFASITETRAQIDSLKRRMREVSTSR